MNDFEDDIYESSYSYLQAVQHFHLYNTMTQGPNALSSRLSLTYLTEWDLPPRAGVVRLSSVSSKSSATPRYRHGFHLTGSQHSFLSYRSGLRPPDKRSPCIPRSLVRTMPEFR